MPESREALEAQLNDFNAARRRAALEALLERVARGHIVLPEPGHAVNMHCHTFFSYNGYGYSPTYIAWRARCEGLRAAGVVDFDVLDAADEFLEACAALGLRGCAGVETRVFIEPFEAREINSPGEPGISYHMGVGFTTGAIADPVLAEFKATAQARNQGVLARVNPFLAPATLDYARDVLPLTPNGNPTERHVCMAYDAKARECYPDDESRAAFWAEKLGVAIADVRAALHDAPALQGLIRSKTMKAGGVGYVKPKGRDFPALPKVNAFIRSANAIPTLTWLDGLSEGEQAIEELLDLMMADGVAAVNIIPDRNWNVKDPDVKKTKVDRLHAFVELTRSHDLPIIVGTEMNAHGQRFVDDFDAPEMRPLAPLFLEGAHIVYAHTLLQANAGMGYLSEWATAHFASARDRNAFFNKVGEAMPPGRVDTLALIDPKMTPAQVLAQVQTS